MNNTQSMKNNKIVITAALFVACGTALFYARCFNPVLDRTLGFPLNQPVGTCAARVVQ
jgi:fructoselysine-6-P-deglycase FrlB-like protein